MLIFLSMAKSESITGKQLYDELHEKLLELESKHTIAEYYDDADRKYDAVADEYPWPPGPPLEIWENEVHALYLSIQQEVSLITVQTELDRPVQPSKNRSLKEKNMAVVKLFYGIANNTIFNEREAFLWAIAPLPLEIAVAIRTRIQSLTKNDLPDLLP